ncbi:MAG: DUF2934 domain-containing protein [Planctomycetota bacterium]
MTPWISESKKDGLAPRPGLTIPAPCSHDDIARLAYLLWEKEGRPKGTDLHYWLKAERILKEKRVVI